MTEYLSIGVVLLQGGILAILLEAVRRRNIAVVVNAFVAFAAALFPVFAEFIFRFAFSQTVSFGPELPLWIAAAGLLHSIGMLGPYESIWWWDSLTHAMSAALVAALIYASLIVVTKHASVFGLAPRSVGGLTVLFTFTVGVFWELIELIAREVGKRYDIEPVLVHYGWRDTVFDLVFDIVGALVVVLVDVQVFVPIAEQSPRVTRAVVLGCALIVIVGSILLTVTVEITSKH